MRRFNFGFTLAEVLITLAIVGVVVAITIPVLMNNIQDYQLKQAFKKEYSVLNQAVKLMANDNGGTMMGLCAGSPNTSNCYVDTYSGYIKSTNICYYGNFYGNCYVVAGTDKYLNGNPFPGGSHINPAGLVLLSGASVGFRVVDTNCANPVASSYTACSLGIMDVNGLKGPNTVGKDIYFFYITANGIKPGGADDSTECSSNGFGCAMQVLSGQ